MTLQAWDRSVGAGQGEWGCAVVEDGRRPGSCVMTRHARVREIACDMIRISNAVVIRYMARITISRSACEYSPLMTINARDSYVGSGQRKRSQVVVK